MKKSADTGNSFSIVLVIVPVVLLALGFREKPKIPLNQMEFLAFATAVTLVLHVSVWMISFWKKKMTGATWALFAVTFFFWWGGTVIGLAALNQRLVDGVEVSHYRKIVRKAQISGGGGGSKSSPSCTIWFDKPLLGATRGPVKYVECEHINVEKDGVHYKVKPGAFGFPWISDYSIVKDFKFFIEKLGIQYEAN